MNRLNDDVISYILEFINTNHYIIVSEVSKYFNFTIKKNHSEQKDSNASNKYVFSSLSILKWFLSHGYKLNKKKKTSYYKYCILYSSNKIKMLNFLYSRLGGLGKSQRESDLFLTAMNTNKENTNILNWLKKKRCKYTSFLFTNLFCMSKENYTWIVNNLICDELKLFDLIRQDDFSIKDLVWVTKSIPSLIRHIPNISCQLGNLEVLKWVYNKFGNKFFSVETIAYAADNGNREILEWLIEINCPWNFWTTSSLASNGNLELLELCLEKGCEINENAVIDSILSGNINSVKLILKKYPELLTKTALETSKENKKKYPDIWTWIYWSTYLQNV